MSWLRLEDNFSDHPKVIDLSDQAFRLHVNALCHCARNLTDGFVSDKAVRRCYPGRVAHLTKELVYARLWSRISGGFSINDYLKYNPTREKVLSDREAANIRMRAVRSQDVRPNVRPNNDRTSPEFQLPRTRPVPLPLSTPSLRDALRAGGSYRG